MVADARLSDARSVVELGPGTGAFTDRILETIRAQTSFFCIEINKAFVEETKRKHPTAIVYHDSAVCIKKYLLLQGHATCDRIISGLPWAAFDPNMQELLLKEIYEALEPGGLFLTFAYYPFNYLPTGTSFKNKLLKRFRKVRQTRVVPNLPPAFIYVCEK